MTVYVRVWRVKKNHYTLIQSGFNNEEARILFDHCIWKDDLNDSPRNRKILANMLNQHGANVIFIEEAP